MDCEQECFLLDSAHVEDFERHDEAKVSIILVIYKMILDLFKRSVKIRVSGM